jgi:hypothetical protein
MGGVRGPLSVAAALSMIGYAGLQLLGRTYGSTRAERRGRLPGDEVVSRPHFAITHAATIDAPAEAVWPWLVQVGWHRAGWYTPRWVDRLLFPANAPSANEIQPNWQGLAVGDFVPDGPAETECGFTVLDLEPNRHLVLHSTSHLPISWRLQGRAAVDWTWAFVLEPAGEGTTRFTFRWRALTRPWWLRVLAWVLIVPADAVMSRGMLRGVASRAERTAREHSREHSREHARGGPAGGAPARLGPAAPDL